MDDFDIDFVNDFVKDFVIIWRNDEINMHKNLIKFKKTKSLKEEEEQSNWRIRIWLQWVTIFLLKNLYYFKLGRYYLCFG